MRRSSTRAKVTRVQVSSDGTTGRMRPAQHSFPTQGWTQTKTNPRAELEAIFGTLGTRNPRVFGQLQPTPGKPLCRRGAQGSSGEKRSQCRPGQRVLPLKPTMRSEAAAQDSWSAKDVEMENKQIQRNASGRVEQGMEQKQKPKHHRHAGPLGSRKTRNTCMWPVWHILSSLKNTGKIPVRNLLMSLDVQPESLQSMNFSCIITSSLGTHIVDAHIFLEFIVSTEPRFAQGAQTGGGADHRSFN